jgi:signal transduction histidine kinase
MYILHKHSQNNHILFENLLQWAKLQRGQITVNKQKLNIHEFCLKTFKHQQNALSFKDLKLEISIDEKICAFADPLLLTSICNNLIGNAIKFSFRGGKIEIIAVNEGNMTKIKIIDHGIGINQNKLDHIFNIENSISSVGTEGEKGSGFGLILCKELVERNGGILEIISNEGQGCTIVISLARAN